MCGVAALFHYHGRAGRVEPQRLRRIRDHMQCRGPDGEGLWIGPEKRIGLAHRRLAIIDLSEAGAQPMGGDDDLLMISFNGEIYNYRALRRQLEEEGRRFRSHCDTEVLLHLYAEKGPAMLRELRGMYAFALWDARRGGLFMARDPYGIKPLYYADDGTVFQAASQVKALLAGGGVDTRPEPAGHVGFFLWGHVPEPHTLYRGVRALPAGCSLWVDADGAQAPRSFASVPQVFAEAAAGKDNGHAGNGRVTPPSDASAKDTSVRRQLREALMDSVQHHLVADVDVGLFLSAGLDSATLAALASEETGRLRTVTLGFEAYRGTPRDEAPLAEAVADHYGARHETVWITRSDFEGAHDHLLQSMDQPTIDGANTYFVSRAAAQAGLKVALSGLGGDELFGGYPSFRQIPRLVSVLGRVPGASVAGRGLRAVAAPVLRHFTSPKYAGLLEYGTDYGGAYLLRRGLFMPWELPELLDPDFAQAGWEALQPRLQVGATAEGVSQPRLKVSAMESRWYMRNQLLRDTDWTSMAHSLEVRTPLVDYALLQKVGPLLAAYPELDKQDMAHTPALSLPDALFQRDKTGFTVPVRQWLLEQQDDPDAERGLRGWARHVYDAYQQEAL